MLVIKIAWAGIKKRKAYSLTIFLLVFIIGALSNIGITMKQKAGQIYDDIHQTIQADHMQYRFGEEYGEQVKDFEQWFRMDQRIQDVKTAQILHLEHHRYNFEGKDEVEFSINLYPDITKKMNTHYEMETLDLERDEVALPVYYRNKYDLKQGDYFDVVLGNKRTRLHIKSFYIDPNHGSDMTGLKYIILNGDKLSHLIEDVKIAANPSHVSILWSLGVVVKSEHIEDIEQINDDFYENNQVPMTISHTLTLYKTATLFLTNIMITIVIVFAVLVLFIILLVVRNAIESAIETDYTNIGILKALGFTSHQILLSIVLQFSSLTLIGTVFGIGVSLLLMPWVGNSLLATTGFTWMGYPSAITIILIIMVLLGIMNGLVFMIAKKVMKITPVEAIVGGKSDVYFNPHVNIPLKKLAVLPRSLRMAIKQTLTRANQYIMLMVISSVLGLTMGIVLIAVSVFGNEDTAATIFGANSKANIVIKGPDEASVERIIQEITHNYSVPYYDMMSSDMVSVGSRNIYSVAYQDFEKGHMQAIKGRLPKYDNEVSLTKVLASQLNKKIGDAMMISDVTGKEKLRFIITGYHQSVMEMGNNMLITSEGLKRINHHASLTTGELFMDYTDDMDKTIEALQKTYVNHHNGIMIAKLNHEETLIDTINHIMSGVMLGICLLVGLIISILTMLMALIAIHKEKKEFGVYKALGYDTLGIRLQFVARFGTVAFIGALIGSVVGRLIGGDFLERVLSSIGIGKLQVDFNGLHVLIPIALIAMVAYVVAYVVSNRVKKVSPRDLISE